MTDSTPIYKPAPGFRAYCLRVYRQLHAAEAIMVVSNPGRGLPPRAEKMLRWLERRYRDC